MAFDKSKLNLTVTSEIPDPTLEESFESRLDTKRELDFSKIDIEPNQKCSFNITPADPRFSNSSSFSIGYLDSEMHNSPEADIDELELL